jgi:hypothetical protein
LNTKVGQQPTVEITNLSTQYDFLFNTLSLRRDYVQNCQSASIYSEELLLARFFSAYGPISENIVVRVKESSGNTTLSSVNLPAYLREHPQADPDDIDILFEFTDGNVLTSITLPSWGSQIVDPKY